MNKEEKLIYLNRAIYILKNKSTLGICGSLIISMYHDLLDFYCHNNTNITNFISINFQEIFKYKPNKCFEEGIYWFHPYDCDVRIKIIEQVIKDIENG